VAFNNPFPLPASLIPLKKTNFVASGLEGCYISDHILIDRCIQCHSQHQRHNHNHPTADAETETEMEMEKAKLTVDSASNYSPNPGP
jgi:hypothetical protein